MSNPQISRRCSTCGASIRERAFFCPQCGISLEEKGSDTIIENGPATAALETSATTELPATAALELPATAALELPATSAQELPATAALETNDTLPEPIEPQPEGRRTRQGPGGNAPPYGAKAKAKRAAIGAREAFEEDVAPRVKKLRKMSTVVLDEAAYDPSVRFLLVAAALFVVFLAILVLSKLIG